MAASTTAAIDVQRRHGELTPRFRVEFSAPNPGSDARRLQVTLLGPPELRRLDALTVTVRDDHPWRAEKTPLAGGPTQEQVARQIWGPYRFTRGTGPGADPGRGVPGADETGRSTPTGGMPVGETLPFDMEPTWPPKWSGWSPEDWRRQIGPMLRLLLECHREGWEPWVLPCEISAVHDVSEIEVPEPRPGPEAG